MDYCDIFAMTVFLAEFNVLTLKFTLPSSAAVEANTIVGLKLLRRNFS